MKKGAKVLILSYQFNMKIKESQYIQSKLVSALENFVCHLLQDVWMDFDKIF